MMISQLDLRKQQKQVRELVTDLFPSLLTCYQGYRPEQYMGTEYWVLFT